MTAVTDAWPDLIGARLDMAELTGQLENCASPYAGAAAELHDLVRQITQGNLPEAFTDSARAVTSASDAATRAFFLSLGLRNEQAGSGIPNLLTSVSEVLQGYARETMTADAALLFRAWRPPPGRVSPRSAHITGMETTYGHVNTLERFFSYAPDGKLKFDPWNTAYGTVHPDAGQGTGINDVELILNDGEFFQVSGFYRASDGGNFLNYRDAYKKALTAGEYSSIAEIVIVAPAPSTNVTAQAADGTTVIVGQNTQWRTVSLQRRVRFINRPATDPDANIAE